MTEKLVWSHPLCPTPFGSLLHGHIKNLINKAIRFAWNWAYDIGYETALNGDKKSEDKCFMGNDIDDWVERTIDTTFYKAELFEVID